MPKSDLILIGAGGHAHACIDVIEQSNEYRIAGLVGLPEELHTQHMGYSVIATDADLEKLSSEYKHAIITVGQIQSAKNRINLYQQAVKVGFNLPIVVSPSANVSKHSTVGEGTIVMHGAVINAGACVGANCIINTHSLVEHDSIVDDHCHISTGVILNGNVSIGAMSFIGSGSIIKEGITIGKGSVVGMGLSVRHNQPDNARFVGSRKI